MPHLLRIIFQYFFFFKYFLTPRGKIFVHVQHRPERTGPLGKPPIPQDLLPSPEPVAVYVQSPYYPPTHNAGIHNTSVVVCNFYCVEAVIGRFGYFAHKKLNFFAIFFIYIWNTVLPQRQEL
jgi:hypothetical protein